MAATRLFIDEEGYVCFYQYVLNPIILWTLRGDGWEAYVNDDRFGPIYATSLATMPTDKDLKEALRAFDRAMEQ